MVGDELVFPWLPGVPEGERLFLDVGHAGAGAEDEGQVGLQVFLYRSHASLWKFPGE